LSTDEDSQTNTERLLTHLKPDSLAAKLVCAYANAAAVDREKAMKEVLTERLAEIKRTDAELQN